MKPLPHNESMDPSSQPILLDIPEQPTQESAQIPRGKAKLRTVNRQQTTFGIIYVEELIPADHKARAIWDLTGRLNRSGFTEALRTAQGCAGRPAWDPRASWSACGCMPTARGSVRRGRWSG
jgi:hypothetical protein